MKFKIYSIRICSVPRQYSINHMHTDFSHPATTFMPVGKPYDDVELAVKRCKALNESSSVDLATHTKQYVVMVDYEGSVL